MDGLTKEQAFQLNYEFDSMDDCYMDSFDEERGEITSGIGYTRRSALAHRP
jgi:hypothetical protein